MIVDQVRQVLIDAGVTSPEIYTHHGSIVDDSHILVTISSGALRKAGDLKNFAQDLVRVQATLNSSTVEAMLTLSTAIKDALIKYNPGNEIYLSQLNFDSEPELIRRGGDWQWFGIFEIKGCDA